MSTKQNLKYAFLNEKPITRQEKLGYLGFVAWFFPTLVILGMVIGFATMIKF